MDGRTDIVLDRVACTRLKTLYLLVVAPLINIHPAPMLPGKNINALAEREDERRKEKHEAGDPGDAG